MEEVGEGTSPSLPDVLRFRPMPDESPALPTSRLARWIAIALVIAFTVALYFRDGLSVLPLTATPGAAPTERSAN